MFIPDSRIDKKSLCYMGNPRLKKADISLSYTPEQIQEVVKCSNNILYFIKNYVNIVSLDHGLIKFDMYPYQEEIIQTCHDNRFSIFLLSRQMGKTTTVGAFLLTDAIFKDNRRIAIIANKGDTAKEILDRIKKMFEDIPWYMKPGVVEWNKTSIKFSNGSEIISAATTSSSIRGQSMHVVYLDEFAFVQNDVEFFQSTYPVISSGETTKVIITSTPNGMNLFYKMWSDAELKRSLFVPRKYLWNAHPKRDERWKEETLRNINQMQFDQEYECIFFGSSNTLINGSTLQKLAYEDPLYISNSNEFTKIYDLPKEDRSYVACVDVCEGIGKDSSVITIIDVTEAPYVQVAVYSCNTIPPILLADVVYTMATQYNEAFVVIENNSVGKMVVDNLYYELEYENMLTSSLSHSETIVSSSGSGELGIRMTKKSKNIGCLNLKSLIESNTLILRDFQTISELSTFVKRGTSFQAEKGKYDDIVMTLVLFAWLASQPYFEDLTDKRTSTLIKENLSKMEDMNHLIFGFHSDGTEIDDDVNITSL